MTLRITQKEIDDLKGKVRESIGMPANPQPAPDDYPFPDDVRLAWAMPHTLPVIPTATHQSLIMVARPDRIHYISASSGGDLDSKRNLQVDTALRLGCTHVWLLDGDMIYPPDILIRLFKLLKDGADMAGGLCWRGYPPFEPIAKHPEQNRNLLPLLEFKFGEIIKPRATGCACLLVKREVFEGISRPWFQTTWDFSNKLKCVQGEDIYFTEKATKGGFKLWIDTEIDVDHVRETGINRDWYMNHWMMTCLTNNGRDKTGRLEKFLLKVADPEWTGKVLDPLLNGGEEE